LNIDDLTYGQLKQIAAMFTGQEAAAAIASAQPERPVLVTTEHRGVFFGYAGDVDGPTIRMRDCRNVVYWSADLRGFIGLASTGPTKSCKVGPAATMTLRNITSVAEVTPEAVKAFEAAPWVK
jgi:hypothetical protein